jgi:hypothetical protein
MNLEVIQRVHGLRSVFLLLSVMLLTACGGGTTETSSAVVEETTVDDEATLLPMVVSDANFQSTHFAGSGNCASCHNNLRDATGSDFSIESDWSSSLMANSTRDPFWRAKVASEIRRNPALKSALDEKCSRCHAPMANVEAAYEGSAVELFGTGFLNPQNPYYNHAMDGVSCTACHQIDDDGKLGTLEGFSGKFSLVDLSAAERTAFGQYADPAINPMLTNTGFLATYAAHISSSAMCATCHNLKTPFVDSAGNVVSTTDASEFPEQMVYTEWEYSVFAAGDTARSCQDCHMPKTAGVMISTRPSNLPARDNFARHTLIGANTTMLDILAQNKDALGITANGFDTAVIRTRDMLATAADIEVVSEERTDNELIVQLRINNRSGHKLPTSFPSRRAYLHFVVRDEDGKILFESGKTNPDGSVVGADADSDLSRYEPHYDEITRPDQVQIYEAIMQDTDQKVTYTLLRAAAFVKDNRIPPAGFDKNSVGEDVKVVGNAMRDTNFNSGSDMITYRVPVNTDDPVSFSAELKYQALAYAFMLDLFRDNQHPEVAMFESLFNGAKVRAETIASINHTLP